MARPRLVRVANSQKTNTRTRNSRKKTEHVAACDYVKAFQCRRGGHGDGPVVVHHQTDGVINPASGKCSDHRAHVELGNNETINAADDGADQHRRKQRKGDAKMQHRIAISEYHASQHRGISGRNIAAAADNTQVYADSGDSVPANLTQHIGKVAPGKKISAKKDGRDGHHQEQNEKSAFFINRFLDFCRCHFRHRPYAFSEDCSAIANTITAALNTLAIS